MVRILVIDFGHLGGKCFIHGTAFCGIPLGRVAYPRCHDQVALDLGDVVCECDRFLDCRVRIRSLFGTHDAVQERTECERFAPVAHRTFGVEAPRFGHRARRFVDVVGVTQLHALLEILLRTLVVSRDLPIVEAERRWNVIDRLQKYRRYLVPFPDGLFGRFDAHICASGKADTDATDGENISHGIYPLSERSIVVFEIVIVCSRSAC